MNEQIIKGLDEVIEDQNHLAESFPDSLVNYKERTKVLEVAREILLTGKKGEDVLDSFNAVNKLANVFARHYFDLIAGSNRHELYNKYRDFAITLSRAVDALFNAYAEGPEA